MVKPQAKIRPEHTRLSEEPEGSVDSYDAEVLSRDEGGREASYLIPDFIIVKATGSLHEDRLLAVVEVKPEDASQDEAEEQLQAYLEMVMSKNTIAGEPIAHRICGILVSGSDVKMIDTVATAAESMHYTSSCNINGRPVHRFLRNISLQNWAVP
jgi:hypothetical protein